MSPNKRRDAFLVLSACAVLILAFVGGYALMHRASARSAFLDICDLVEEKFYLDNQDLQKWLATCRRRAKELPLFASHARLIETIQDQMDRMQVSHFMIYSPAEDQKLWKGEAQETGLRARWMEDKLIIYQVIRKSPALRAGFRLGDEVVTIDGREPSTADEVQNHSGRYSIRRGGHLREIPLRAESISIDSSPVIRPIAAGTGLVELSSFRSEYFDDQDWREFVGGWKPYSRLLVDLRENIGGNFIAMLRALSPFFCDATAIGELVQPRREPRPPVDLENVLADDSQIAQIERDPVVTLRTFSQYGCFRGPVDLLIGSHTSSVSEIFASAMSRRPHTRILGQPSAGDVVLAIWYDLPKVGEGFSISIPEALFKTPEGEILEGVGVYPTKNVFDDLKIWQTGQDSWIRQALQR